MKEAGESSWRGYSQSISHISLIDTPSLKEALASVPAEKELVLVVEEGASASVGVEEVRR